MSFSSTTLLQFDELTELLAGYAGSEAGRELLYALEPHGDRTVLDGELAEAGEAILSAYGSGPRGGLGEIRLPARQPGSSMMPGKVNPVLPEGTRQVCYRVIGNDLSVTLAAEADQLQLQLNAMEPWVVHSVHESLSLLTSVSKAFATLCVEGIEGDEARCADLLRRRVSRITSLVPVIGYEKAADLAKQVWRRAATSTIRMLAQPTVARLLSRASARNGGEPHEHDHRPVAYCPLG